jgi:DNA-directed RNA polymerase specialized sigma24 family protein
LAYVEGMKHSEIAAIIGKSPAATRVILHRAMKELRKILNQGN